MVRRLLAVLVAGLAAAASTALAVAAPAAAAPSASVVVVDYGADWTYNQVPHGSVPRFYDPAFVPGSTWRTGAAGFGSLDGACPWNNRSRVGTRWYPGTDMLLRRSFDAPGTPVSAHLAGDVDNIAIVYLNGVRLAKAATGFCRTGAVEVDLPVADLRPSGNLLAIRGTDIGGATFLDVQLTLTY